MENYKTQIIAFIEGKVDPESFYSWFDSDPKILDWLQSMIPQEKTFRDGVEVKIDYFLNNLSKQKQDEIYSCYENLCENTDIEHAKKLVDLLVELDAETVSFTNFINVMLFNFKKVFDNPGIYSSPNIQHICSSVKSLFEQKYTAVVEVPYDVKNVYSHNKRGSKLWTYVNIQSWLYQLMTEIYPNDSIQKDETLHNKATFMLDVCPDYIEGDEIDQAGIIEKIIDQVPETLPKSKRIKQIKELIKKEFHLKGFKHPHWIQSGEWPVSKSGKPMRFVGQKRKKGKDYENTLYTVYTFEDVDTLERRTIDQFT